MSHSTPKQDFSAQNLKNTVKLLTNTPQEAIAMSAGFRAVHNMLSGVTEEVDLIFELDI